MVSIFFLSILAPNDSDVHRERIHEIFTEDGSGTRQPKGHSARRPPGCNPAASGWKRAGTDRRRKSDLIQTSLVGELT